MWWKIINTFNTIAIAFFEKNCALENSGHLYMFTYSSIYCIEILEKLVQHTEFFSESCWIEPNLDCNYTFPIDLASNGFLFGAKHNNWV